MSHQVKKRIVLGITGASGIVYGLRLLDVLAGAGVEIHLVVSPAARQVAQWESGSIGDENPIDLLRQKYFGNDAKKTFEKCPSNLVVHDPTDFAAPIASGSFSTDGMIVAPCSTNTLGSIAAGINGHLIHRAAEVHLKERRRLVLLLRESPLSLIHLENMERVSRAGGVVQPATPHFYASTDSPPSIADLIDSVVSRSLDLLGMEHDLGKRWGN